MKQNYYLDANAHIPINPIALQEYVNFNGSLAGHGHALSHSLTGRESARLLEESRAKIAAAINCKNPGQIIFTSGCTQACQWGLEMFAKIGLPKPYIVSMSQVEHPASYMAAEEICRKDLNCIEFRKLGVWEDGFVPPPYRPRDFFKTICVYVQNEIGTIQNIKAIRDESDCLFSDMSQALGKIPVNVQSLQADIAVFGAHKFGGISGVGFIYISDGNYWEEFGTGSRYFTDITGTPNVAGIYASSIALEEAMKTLIERSQKAKSFQDKLEPGLEELGFEIIGKTTKRVPHVTFAKVPNSKYYTTAVTIMDQLAEKGIYIGLGSACGSLHSGGSKLMDALGRPSDGMDYIRISQWGEYDDRDADYVLKCIDQVL